MPYNPLAGLTPEEVFLTHQIRGDHGDDSPPHVTNGAPMNYRAYLRNIELEAAWGERASEEREELFRRQGKQYHDLFGIADDAPFAPHKD